MDGERKGRRSSELRRAKSNGILKIKITEETSEEQQESTTDDATQFQCFTPPVESESHRRKRAHTIMYAIPENAADFIDSPNLDELPENAEPVSCGEGMPPLRGRSLSFLAPPNSSTKQPDIADRHSPVGKKRGFRISGPNSSKHVKTTSLPNPYLQQPNHLALERTPTVINVEIREDQRSPSECHIDLSTEIFNKLHEKVKEKFKVVHYREKDFTAGDDFATIDKVATKQALKNLSKDQKKQQNVLLEFLNSERKQTFNLKLLAQVFESVLRSNNSSGGAVTSSLVLFQEISKLLDFHFTFYTKLLTGVTPDFVIQEFGPVFIEMFERSDYRNKFAEYYRWISCKTFKAEKVRKLEEDNRSLLKRRSLQDLLVSEFQRATKYKLLLESILTCAAKTGGPEKDIIERAVKSVTNLVAGIDKDKGLQDYRIFISKVDRGEIIRENSSEPNSSSNELSFELSIADIKQIKLQESEPMKYGTYFVLINYVKHKNDSIQNSVHLFKKYLILFFPKYLIFIESDTSTDKMTWKTYLDKEKRFKSVISLNDILHVTSDSTKPLKDEQTDFVKNQSMNFTLLCHSYQVIVYVNSQDEKSKWMESLAQKVTGSLRLRQLSTATAKKNQPEVKFRERAFTSKRQHITHPTVKGDESSGLFARMSDISRPLSVVVTNLDKATLDLYNEQHTELQQTKSSEDSKSFASEKKYLDPNSGKKGQNLKSRISVSMSDISKMGMLNDNDVETSDDDDENSGMKSWNDLPVSTEDIELQFLPSPTEEKSDKSSEKYFGNDKITEIGFEVVQHSDLEKNDSEKDVSANESEVLGLGSPSAAPQSDDTTTGTETSAEQPHKSPGTLKNSSPYNFASSCFYTENVNLDNLKGESSTDDESGDDCVDLVDKIISPKSQNDYNEENDSKFFESSSSLFDEIAVPEQFSLLQNLTEAVKAKFEVLHYWDDEFTVNDHYLTIDKLMSKEVFEKLSGKQKNQQNILLEFLNGERKQTFELKLLCDVFDPVPRGDSNNSSVLIPETKKLMEFHFTFYIKLLNCFTPDYVIQDAETVFVDMFGNNDYRSKFIEYYTWASWVSFDTKLVLKIEAEKGSELGERSFQSLLNSEFLRVQRYEKFLNDVLKFSTGCSGEESNSLFRAVQSISNEMEFITNFKLKFDYRLLISKLDSSEVNDELVTANDHLKSNNSIATLADGKTVDLDSSEPLFYGTHFVMMQFLGSESDCTGSNPSQTQSPELKKFLVILLPESLVLVESHPETNKLCWRPYVDESKTVSSVVPIKTIQQVASDFPISLDDCQMEFVDNGLLNFTCVCASLQLIVFVSTLEERNKWVDLIKGRLPMTSDEKHAKIFELRSNAIGLLKKSLDLARSVFDPENILEPEKLSRAHEFVVNDQLLCLVDKECWMKKFDSPLMSLPGHVRTSDAIEISDVTSCVEAKIKTMKMNDKDTEKELSEEVFHKDDVFVCAEVPRRQKTEESPKSNEFLQQTSFGAPEDIEQGCLREIAMLNSLIGETGPETSLNFDKNCDTSLSGGLRSITGTLISPISAASDENLCHQRENINLFSFLKEGTGLNQQNVRETKAGGDSEIGEKFEDGDCSGNINDSETKKDFSYQQLDQEDEETDQKNQERGGLEPGTAGCDEDSNESAESKGNTIEDTTKIEPHGCEIVFKEPCQILINPCFHIDPGLDLTDSKETENEAIVHSNVGRKLSARLKQVFQPRVPTFIRSESSDDDSKSASEDEENDGNDGKLAEDQKTETSSDDESNP